LGRLIIHSVFLVYVLGALFAIVLGAKFDIIKFIFVYIILLTGTFSAVYNNNYNDVNIDKNSTQTFFSGGSRILIDHPDLLPLTKKLSLFFLLLSNILGLISIFIFSYPITFFIFILVGNIAGWYYTAPPIKLVYRGLGEIGTMLAVCFFVPGLGYFAMTNKIDLHFITLLIPLLFYGISLSLYLEIPDKNADLKGHKKTLVVRRGLNVGFFLGAFLSFIASITYLFYGFFYIITGNINYWFVLLFSLLPLIISIYSFIEYRINKSKINTLSFISTGSYFLFFILLDIYFSYLVLK